MQQLSLEYIQPRYLWLDPASGKRDAALRSVRARSAMVVIGASLDQKVFVLDAWAKRTGTAELARVFVDMCQKWGPVVAGFEDMGQQSLLWDPIMQESDARGVIVPLSPFKINTKVEKNWRIRTTLQPLIGHGRLLINHELLELKSEITQFPMSNMKDMIDALAGACSLLPPPKLREKSRGEDADLVRYLQDTGVPLTEVGDALSRTDVYNGSDYMPKWQRDLRNSYSLKI